MQLTRLQGSGQGLTCSTRQHARTAAAAPYRLGCGSMHHGAAKCISMQQHWQQHNQQQQRGRLIQRHAGPIDVAPTWTLDQIAGLAFGFVMLAFYFGSKQVDVVVAKQQRKQLGLCESCGGLNEPSTCSQGNCPMKAK